MPRLSATLCLLLAVLFSGGESGARAAENAAEIEGPEWALTALHGQAVAEGRRGPATLRFDAEKKTAGGLAGVNRYSGGYERTGDRLKFGALIATRMAGPPEAMAAESAYLAALAATTHWRLDGGALEFLHEGKVVARFVARPAPAK